MLALKNDATSSLPVYLATLGHEDLRWGGAR